MISVRTSMSYNSNFVLKEVLSMCFSYWIGLNVLCCVGPFPSFGEKPIMINTEDINSSERCWCSESNVHFKIYPHIVLKLISFIYFDLLWCQLSGLWSSIWYKYLTNIKSLGDLEFCIRASKLKTNLVSPFSSQIVAMLVE